MEAGIICEGERGEKSASLTRPEGERLSESKGE